LAQLLPAPDCPKTKLSGRKIWPKVRTGRVHGARLEVHEDGAGHVASARSLVEVDVDALELEVEVAIVLSGGVDTVLVADDLPELGTDLVTTLSGLRVSLEGTTGFRERGREAENRVRSYRISEGSISRASAVRFAQRNALEFGNAQLSTIPRLRRGHESSGPREREFCVGRTLLDPADSRR
jgi:hypothetical protein